MIIERKSIRGYDGAPINIYEYLVDDPDGVVIFCHGITADWSEEGFNKQIAQQLDNRKSCIFMEMRGHGESVLNYSDFSISSIVSDILRVANYARGEKVQNMYLLSSSFSGGAALLASVILDRLIKKIILINPRISYSYWLDEIPGWDKCESQFYESLRSGLVRKGDWIVSPSLLNDLITVNAWHCVPQLSAPLLVLHGTSDTVIPFEDSQKFSELTGAELILLKDVDHGIVHVDPNRKIEIREQISTKISSWLSL